MPAAWPAPASTLTEGPAATSWVIERGTSATRVSPAAVSAGTAMRMIAEDSKQRQQTPVRLLLESPSHLCITLSFPSARRPLRLSVQETRETTGEPTAAAGAGVRAALCAGPDDRFRSARDRGARSRRPGATRRRARADRVRPGLRRHGGLLRALRLRPG